jgi:hypothetical protein
MSMSVRPPGVFLQAEIAYRRERIMASFPRKSLRRRSRCAEGDSRPGRHSPKSHSCPPSSTG